MANTIKVTDDRGNEFEVETGEDGKNPVSPNNPPAKARLDIAPAVQVGGAPAPAEEPPTEDDSTEEDDLPAGNASRDEWVEFAKSEEGGEMADEELEGLTRDEIRDLYVN